MESWFADAKRIESLEAEICFLLQEGLYYGPDSFPEVAERSDVEPLPSPDIARHTASMVCSAEALGHEEELAIYYREVVRVARQHRKTFNDIRQYFWLRLLLWNCDANVRIAFPWYDTYSEIASFLDSVTKDTEGRVFWDADQCWELEMHSANGELFIRLHNPDDDKAHAVVRLPRKTLVKQIRPLRERTESLIRFLSVAIGQDVWTHLVEWPEFLPPQKPDMGGACPWWKVWKGRTKR